MDCPVLSVVAAWITFNALFLAINANSNPPANLPPQWQPDYVHVAWIGFIGLTVMTTAFILLAVRAFKKHNNRSHY